MPTSPAQLQEGDPVVIVGSPETIEAGLAGLDGHVAGYTQPSQSGVPVIGALAADNAIGILIPDHWNIYWLSPNLVRLASRAGAAGDSGLRS